MDHDMWLNRLYFNFNNKIIDDYVHHNDEEVNLDKSVYRCIREEENDMTFNQKWLQILPPLLHRQNGCHF